MSNERGYLHGYSETERQRLVRQSTFLEPWIYKRVDLAGRSRLLEVGCGVGAQLKILARRYPQLSLTGIDLVASQIEAAHRYLEPEILAEKVVLHVGDGGALPFADQSFDAGFLCWVLEHAPERTALLSDLRRVLEPGAVLFCTEVFLASLQLVPQCRAISRLWQLCQDYQVSIGGDPQAGVRLGTWLSKAGFGRITIDPLLIELDRRQTDMGRRARFWDYWYELMQSAIPGLAAAGLLDKGLTAAVDADFAVLRTDPDAIFHIDAVQARAFA